MGTEGLQKKGRSKTCWRRGSAPLLQLQERYCAHFPDSWSEGLGVGCGVGAVEDMFLFLLVLPRRYTGEGDSLLVGLETVNR